MKHQVRDRSKSLSTQNEIKLKSKEVIQKHTKNLQDP